MITRRSLLLALPAAAILAGCGSLAPIAPVTVVRPSLKEGSAEAADQILDQLRDRGVLTDDPLLVLTFQELRYLRDSRGLGKVAAEMVASRLVKAGRRVVDLRYAGAITITESNGETVLSRDVAKLASSHNAKVVVTGTYVDLGGEVNVSIRAVSSADGVVLASADFSISAESVKKLLG